MKNAIYEFSEEEWKAERDRFRFTARPRFDTGICLRSDSLSALKREIKARGWYCAWLFGDGDDGIGPPHPHPRFYRPRYKIGL